MDYLVMNQPSVLGHRYALNIVDHFSGVPKSYTCKTRDEVQYYILQYLAETEYLCGELTTVCCKSDNAKEFISRAIHMKASRSGMYMVTTTPYGHE